MFIVYAKAAVSVVLSLVLLVLLWQRGRLETGLNRSPLPWLWLFWLGLRVLPFAAVYLWLGYMPQSDVKEYYFPIGTAAGAGKMIYRDVYCPYGPFFGYYVAGPLLLWPDPRVIVLTMTGVEALAVWLTCRFWQGVETRGQQLFRVLFYYLLPVPFVFCLLSGQEDVLLWIFALLGGWAVVNGRAYIGGLILALGLLSTKAVFVLLLVPFFFVARDKVRYVAGLATLGVPVLIWLYAQTGTLFLTQPLEEGTYLKDPNLRSVLAPLLGESINRFVKVENYVGLLFTAGLSVVAVWRTRIADDYRRLVPALYTLVFATMTVVQHNAISTYAYLFMLPLVFADLDFRNRRTCLILIGFNLAAAVHPSLWWRIGQPFYFSFGQINRPLYQLEYALQLLVVAGFVWIAYRAWTQLRAIK
jgi:hypothetical protein